MEVLKTARSRHLSSSRSLILFPFSVVREIRSLCRSSENTFFTLPTRHRMWRQWKKIVRHFGTLRDEYQRSYKKHDERGSYFWDQQECTCLDWASSLTSLRQSGFSYTNPSTKIPVATLSLSQEISTRCLWPRVIEGEWSVDTQILCVALYLKHISPFLDVTPFQKTSSPHEKYSNPSLHQMLARIRSSRSDIQVYLATNDQSLQVRAKHHQIPLCPPLDEI